jgi:hypothetical protein
VAAARLKELLGCRVAGAAGGDLGGLVAEDVLGDAGFADG